MTAERAPVNGVHAIHSGPPAPGRPLYVVLLPMVGGCWEIEIDPQLPMTDTAWSPVMQRKAVGPLRTVSEN